MAVNGRAHVNIEAGIQRGRLSILVSSDLDEEMLLGISTLKDMDRIPQGFPNYILDRNIELGTYKCCAAKLQDCQSLLERLFNKYNTTLSDDLNPKPMKGDRMRINLKADAVPKKVMSARRVPLRYEKEADKVIQDLIDKLVIKPVKNTTDWCSPAFFVPKSDNIRMRLVTDYTHLNKYVKRPVHPFPCTKEVLQAIPSSAIYFAKLDAVHGYFQLALENSSSYITTFLLPQGKFRYLRAPMGLNASSDEWCCQSDVIVQGLTWAKKLVDDTLIWADSMAQLQERIDIVLDRCKEANITISKKKLEIGKEIEFAGHLISAKGIKPDPSKYAAIKEFPSPKCIRDLRAFLGLANQLGNFIPDLAHLTSSIRPLLKKGVAWMWLDEHENAFRRIKDVLTSETTVKPFDPNKDTILLTDASRLHGLGFALVQQHRQGLSLVQCGSCSITPTQQRYATIELECLAIKWAMHKCNFYIRGLPDLQIWTDHRPLVGIFQKDLPDIDNPRLLNLREKIQHYNFKVHWVAGKTHYIADALSRFPIFNPDPKNDEEVVFDAVSCLRVSKDPAIAIIEEINNDKRYLATLEAIYDDADPATLPADHPAKEYSAVFHELSIRHNGEQELILKDGKKIVVPQLARERILKSLHRAHSGYTKTYSTARQLYYWPNMKKEIQDFVDNCMICQQDRPTQARPTCEGKNPADVRFPMAEVGVDLFDAIGKKWLAMTDRFSGYGWVAELNKTTTERVTKQLSTWFNDYGWPNAIRTDGGPQFRTEFQEFCSNFSVKHELASAHNPESNGLAEAGVKNMKSIVTRTHAAKESLQEAIAAWRNMARSDGKSPSQLFFGRRQRHALPLTNDLLKCDTNSNKCREKNYSTGNNNRNAHSKDYPPLQLGQQVLMQHHISGEWYKTVTVIEIRDGASSYWVEDTEGRRYLRGRRLLKPVKSDQ